MLANGVKADDVIHYVNKVISTGNENVKENVRTVIEVCLSANKNLGKELRETGKMDDIFKDTFRYLFEKDFANERQQGIQEDRERVAIDMLNNGEPIDKIKTYSRLTEDVIKGLAVSL